MATPTEAVQNIKVRFNGNIWAIKEMDSSTALEFVKINPKMRVFFREDQLKRQQKNEQKDKLNEHTSSPKKLKEITKI